MENPLEIFEVKNNKINLTKLAASQRKDVREWLKNQSTKAYVSALEEARGNSPQLEVINGVGTFGTREVAIKLAQWISPQFEVYCTSCLDELFSKGRVEITQLSRKDILKMALEAEEKAEQLALENQRQAKVIEDQNQLNISLYEMKAMQSRTGLKALKDDLGVEINSYVFQLFPNIASFRTRHTSAHALYTRMTGYVYGGSNKASLESKKHYLKFLKAQVAKLKDESVNEGYV